MVAAGELARKAAREAADLNPPNVRDPAGTVYKNESINGKHGKDTSASYRAAKLKRDHQVASIW